MGTITLLMDHFEHIYTDRAREYHRMISAEDADGNLLPALLRAASLPGERPLAGRRVQRRRSTACGTRRVQRRQGPRLRGPRRVLDLGGGTGRIPLLLEPLRPQIVSLDLHRAMLIEQARQRERIAGTWPLVQADMRWLPVATGWAEVAIAGWSIGHLRGWYAQDWQAQIGRVLGEMQRAVQPGGALIILETMTTGSLAPAPPSPELAEYYAWLEGEWGFRREVISTDYQFESVEQAVEFTQFFFGAELADKIRAKGWARLPEWTGLWVKK